MKGPTRAPKGNIPSHMVDNRREIRWTIPKKLIFLQDQTRSLKGSTYSCADIKERRYASKIPLTPWQCGSLVKFCKGARLKCQKSSKEQRSTKKNSCDMVPCGGNFAPNPSAGNILSLKRKVPLIRVHEGSMSNLTNRSPE